MNDAPSDWLETIFFSSTSDFDHWLAKNYTNHEGVWIKMAKLNSGVPSITSDQAVDVGLCWGWISSHRKRFDDRYFLQKYTPRRPGSNWSKVNVNKAEALIAAARMRSPGLAEVLAAKADGRWKAVA